MNLKNKNIPAYLFIILVLITGLVPNYGALDRIATQWFYLSVVNSFGLLYFLFVGNFKKNIIEFIRYKPFSILCLFILWGLFSFLYAVNSIEVLVKFVRWIQIPLTLINLIFIYSEYKFDFVKFISLIIALVLIVELYFSYSPYFQIEQVTDYNFSFANIIKGATGNKNITAASILIKTPFVIYLIYNFKNQLIRFLILILSFSAFYMVFLLSARSSIIAFFLVLTFLSIISFKKIIKWKNKVDKSALLLIVSTFIFSALLFQFNFRDNNTASFTKRVSTINSDDTSTQQRLRFYNHSIEQIKTNPIFGVGLGNWKIKSIDYDKEDVEGYIIPYHTHNDFLEIGTELGLVGLFLYVLVFYFPFINVVRSKSYSGFNLSTLILCAGIIYFIDANLNFPHARPVMQIPFILTLFFSYINNKTKDVSIY